MEVTESSPVLVESDPTNDINHLFGTDTGILLSILPSNVWAYTFKKLEKKHSSSLENLTNSSLCFRNLIRSKRVLFLFPQVFKLIGPQFANQKNTRTQGSNVIRSRIICKDWNKAVDQFIIDGTLHPDFFNTQPPQPSDHALVNAKYQYFSHNPPTKLPKFLTHFQQTHSPHSPRNPFIGKVLHIDLTGFTLRAEWASIADQVSTLLRKYGHHIKILNLSLFSYQPDNHVQLQNHCFLLECLGYCPNLTHLKVSERFNSIGEMDVTFGERPDPRRRRRRPGHQIATLLAGYVHYQREEYEGMREQLYNQLELMGAPWENLPRRQFPMMGDVVEPELNPDWQPGHVNIRDIVRPMDRHQDHHHHHHHRVPPRPRPVIPPIRPIDANPLTTVPTLQHLQCLKLCQLSHYSFNSLISANTHVDWLQVELLNEEKGSYIDYHSLELPNLRKLYIKLCSPAEVRKLRSVHQSWLQLTHLHFEYCTSETCCISPEFMEWIEIFGVISQKWGNTLTDLRLRLPMARKEEDKEKIVRDSGQFRLYLPRLKRLKIWLSERPDGRRVAKTDFLDLLRVGLEQLIIE